MGFHLETILRNVCREIRNRRSQANEQTVGRVLLQSQDKEVEQAEGT